MFSGVRDIPASQHLCRNPCPEDELLRPLFERRPVEENSPVAGQAAQADIGAEPRHLPVITAAGMRFAQADHVSEIDLEDRPTPPPAGSLRASAGSDLSDSAASSRLLVPPAGSRKRG